MKKTDRPYAVATFGDRTLQRRIAQAEAWKKKCEERKRLLDLAHKDINLWRAEMRKKLKRA